MINENAFRIVFESASKNAPHIPTGSAFPDGACTTFVISNHKADEIIGRVKDAKKKNIFFNTQGKAFFFETAADFDKRFKPMYADDQPTSNDGEWSIYYSTHAHDADIINHIAENPRLAASGIVDIAGMIASSRVTLQQVGKLFKMYADIEDQQLIDMQVDRNRGRKGDANPHYIGA